MCTAEAHITSVRLMERRYVWERFPGMDVRCDDLSMGVACHIGYGGLGIGCSCCPDAALD